MAAKMSVSLHNVVGIKVEEETARSDRNVRWTRLTITTTGGETSEEDTMEIVLFAQHGSPHPTITTVPPIHHSAELGG